MKKLFIRGAMLLCVFLIAACSGGGGSETVVPESVSGVVADGYLIGAKVFSDRNGNKKWDDGEPFTKTIAGGTYKLEGDDLEKHPLVVEVTATVIDEDTGEAVGKPYVLSAPIGKPEFISPITTLVQARIEKDGLSVDDAEIAIQTLLGTSADLFSDYIETGGTPSDDQKNLRKVAQVVANAFGEFQEQIEAKVAGTDGVDIDEDYGAIIAIVVKEVEAKLTQIVAAVENLGDETVIPSGMIDSIVDSIDDDVQAIDIEKEVEGEKDTNIVGSWLLSEGDGMRNVLTFIDEERYIIIHEHDDDENQDAGSVEYGTYTWDTTTGAFEVFVINDDDGYGGLWDEFSRWTTAVIGNNTLTLHLSYKDEDFDIDFTRVTTPAESLVGAYVFEEDEDNINVLTILSDTEYVMAHNNNSGEFGTYSYVGSTFTVSSAPVNTDGEGGLYDDGGMTYTVTTQSGKLYFSDNIDENFVFTRIVNIQKDTEAETEAATQLLTDLKNLVEAALVDTQAIGGYLHEDFLHSDCTKTGFIEWCQSDDDEDQIDLSDFVSSLAEATVVEVIQSSEYTTMVMDYGDNSYMELRDDGNGLQLYGDQQLWSANIQTEAFGSASSVTSVWGLGADGDIFEPGDYILVRGQGFPEDGYKMIQHEFNNPEEEETPGRFTSVCFVDELKVPELNDEIINDIGDNEKYLFTRYKSNNDVKESYEVMLRQRPYKSSETSSFPAITSPGEAGLSEIQAGDDLAVTWDLPAGTQSNEITLFLGYTDGTTDRVDIELEGNAESVTFPNIEINSELTVNMYGLYIYAEDTSGRTVASGFGVEAAAVE